MRSGKARNLGERWGLRNWCDDSCPIGLWFCDPTIKAFKVETRLCSPVPKLYIPPFPINSHSSIQPTLFITSFRCMGVFYFEVLACDTGLHYLRNRKLCRGYKRWIMSVWIIKILRIASVFSTILLLWIPFSMNNTMLNIYIFTWILPRD